MIKSFKHKDLKCFFENNDNSKIPSTMIARIRIRLSALDAAGDLSDLNVASFDFHPLKGYKPVRYTIHVNGPYCLTFSWDNDVIDLDLENYH